jgi:hypothetical protein
MNYSFVIILGCLPDCRNMLYILIPARAYFLEPYCGKISSKDSCSCDIVIDAIKKVFDTGCERNYTCINREILFAIIDVVSNYLYAEVRHGIKAFLGKEDSTYPLRTLKMTEFKCDELLQTVQVAIYCCIVPPR